MSNLSDNKHEQYLRLLMLNDRNIYSYILAMVPNVNDADDIMQETTIVMWRKFDDFKPGMDFVAWGMTVARYQVLSYYKKLKNSKICYSESLLDSIEKVVEKTIPEMDEKLNALNKCVQKLSVSQRRVLKLRYDKKMTFKEIGVHISKSTRATFYTISKIHQILLGCVKTTQTEELC